MAESIVSALLFGAAYERQPLKLTQERFFPAANYGKARECTRTSMSSQAGLESPPHPAAHDSE